MLLSVVFVAPQIFWAKSAANLANILRHWVNLCVNYLEKRSRNTINFVPLQAN